MEYGLVGTWGQCGGHHHDHRRGRGSPSRRGEPVPHRDYRYRSASAKPRAQILSRGLSARETGKTRGNSSTGLRVLSYGARFKAGCLQWRTDHARMLQQRPVSQWGCARASPDDIARARQGLAARVQCHVRRGPACRRAAPTGPNRERCWSMRARMVCSFRGGAGGQAEPPTERHGQRELHMP